MIPAYLTKIEHMQIPVRDLDQSIEWYLMYSINKPCRSCSIIQTKSINYMIP